MASVMVRSGRLRARLSLDTESIAAAINHRPRPLGPRSGDIIITASGSPPRAVVDRVALRLAPIRDGWWLCIGTRGLVEVRRAPMDDSEVAAWTLR